MSPRYFPLFVVLVVCLVYSSAGAQSLKRMPVLIDTDIGTGIGDAFAMGLAFGSYEIDVRGITTVGGDTRNRAMMVCRFLTMTGRRHTRVAAGTKPQPKRPLTKQYKYYYHPDALFNRTTKPEKQSAVEFLNQRIKQQPNKVTLIALGPLTNVAKLIQTYPKTGALLHHIVLLESNIAHDVSAAQQIFRSKIPVLIVSNEACRKLKLNDADVKRVFSPGTPLTRQVQTMYQMWDSHNPTLAESFAVSLCFEKRFATIKKRSLILNDKGELKIANGPANVRVITSVRGEKFVKWYVGRMSSLVPPNRKPSRVLRDDKMPHRVHVAEDYDNDIERFWWMSGKPETKLLPPGSRRACRGVLTHDFDDLLMVSRKMYSAVIFNPVPGPPMGKNTRLRFRYWLKGTDAIRVQLYSLTNGYHRHLVVKGLPQGKWQTAVVDMTEARRPDGTGGPLGENERIDDIQFYVDPDAELIIDDVVLYDAARDGEKRPFPNRIVFAGVFDTGKQEKHWPGEFEFVRDAGNFWRAVRSVPHEKTKAPWIRLGLRGQRRVGDKTYVSFRYRLKGSDTLRVRLLNTKTGKSNTVEVKQLKRSEWAQSTVEFATKELASIDELQVLLPERAEMVLDDLLVFEN